MSKNKHHKKIFAGNIKFLEKCGVVFSKSDIMIVQKEKSFGRMIVAFGIDSVFVGLVTLSDLVRSHACYTVSELKKLGVERTVILSGDNEIVAGEIAKKIGITEFQANLLPKDKVNFVRKSLNKQYKIGMIGDGINDAAALTLADISFSMGIIGSDVAIEAADIALMKDDLRNVVDAIQMSKNTMKVVKQDLI